MAEYATLLSISVKNWFQSFHLDLQVLLPGILIAGAILLVIFGLIKPPKV